jgi:filamentous hemagglutinin family protein
MRKTKPDVPGIIAGTVLSGGATIFILNDNGVVPTDDLGLTAALLLVAAGIIGLVASQRG